jgi:hypothetical protein
MAAVMDNFRRRGILAVDLYDPGQKTLDSAIPGHLTKQKHLTSTMPCVLVLGAYLGKLPVENVP